MIRFFFIFIFIINFIIYSQPIEVAFYDAGLLYHDGIGIDKDVIKELSKRTGIEFKETKKPRARIWGELEEGILTMTVSGIQNEARDKFAYFIPYIAQKNMVIITKGSLKKYKTLDDFVKNKKVKIAVVRGFVHGAKYDKAIELLKKENRVSEVSSIDTLYKMMNFTNDRVDLILGLPVFYNYHLKKLKMEDKVDIIDWDINGPNIKHCLVLSKKLINIETYNKLNSAINQMKSDGTLKKIYLKYLSESEVNEALKF